MMSQKLAVRKLAQVIYLGVPFVSLLVVTGVVTDPVNSTKLAALVALSFPILALLSTRLLKQLLSENLALLIVSMFFVLAMLISISKSDSPLSQNIYGVYGRSTGFLAYFALTVFMLGAASINAIKYHGYLVKGFLITGLINMIYCAWVLVFGDFIGWSNPYGEILGLFGNPNFIGAFLGMFLVGTIAILLQKNIQYQWRISGLVVVGVTFFEIVKSRAIQGLVVSAGGVALVGLLYLWSKRVKPVFIGLYVLMISVLATFSIFGALQRGPFDFIYKRSVSLRGTYWESGFQMGIQNPFSGVGMDAYGDWYRRARPPRALIDTPGIETVTNAAHNVFLDIFSYGGFPLLLSYLGILSFGLRAVIKFMTRRNPYDGIFATLAVVWLCYQVQSLISINQIGLAVWGWVLTGALVSYERLTRILDSQELGKVSTKRSKSRVRVNSRENVSSGLIAGVGLMVGMIVALPPVAADNKWWSALQARDLKQIEDSLTPGYFNPSNSQKYAQAIDLFQNSNLPDLALKYARASVAFNPDDFTAWFQLYSLANSSPEEKASALINLKRLDPLNPDVTKP
jgi:O-antigen ligase